ncbi:DUF7344 domain-containing protein [Haloprofundus halobius]|uniref:DUF7344 domain-containing protein n=1 Tax=Haloprofundus halobius TaxID=2876194 RepID=UPI001CCBA57D|nr:hypothetical protein [Haloprofundus halobius]
MTSNEDESDDSASESTDSMKDTPLEEIPLSVDAMLDILANSPRRHLLEYLRDQPEGTATVEEATKVFLTQLARESGQQPNHDDAQVDLHHHHLPKLADAGVIEYDVRTQTIRYRPHDRLEELHDLIQDFLEE